jgi:hypothetical protein
MTPLALVLITTQPSSRYCCGDGVCEGAEDETNCAIDCGGPSCGDGNCDPGEDECNCAQDCGTPPSTETVCDDGIDEVATATLHVPPVET